MSERELANVPEGWSYLRLPSGGPVTGYVCTVEQLAARDARIREDALGPVETEPLPPRCAACTWPDDFTSHADSCAVGRILAALGPAEDDWRWTGEVNLRATIRACINTPAQADE
jgi:hypothetical protein